MVDMDDLGGGYADVGAMVIRVWSEPDQEPGFRARLTFGGPEESEPAVSVVTNPEEVLQAVRSWLSRFSSAEPPVPTPDNV